MRRRIGLVLTVVIGVVGSTLSVSAGVVGAEPGDTEEGPELVTQAVTQEACVQGGTCFPTVQAAVNAASSGGTVTVSAGTFNESVQIDKPLTLLGPNSGLPFNPLTTTNRLPEATLLAPSAVLPAIKVVANIGAVTVSGVTVTSPGGISLTTTIKLIEVVAPGNSFTLENSLVDLGEDNQCGSALYSKGANELRIIGNHFVDGDYRSACASAYESRTLYISNSPLTSVTGNIFERTGHSIFLEAMPSGTARPQVTGNEFHSGRQHLTIGITGSGLDVSGNTFRQGNGMYFDSSANVSIKNNDFLATQQGFSFWATKAEVSTYTLSTNAFGSPGYLGLDPTVWADYLSRAIFHAATGNLNITGNWWGTNQPGGTVQLFNNASRTFTAVPAITSYRNDPARLGQPGFWPTPLVNTTTPSQRSGTVTLSAQLESVAGSQVSFTVNGVNRGTATIDDSGRATMSAVLQPGSYQVAVSSAGETSPDPVTLNVFSRSVCPSGCDHPTIQEAIDAASRNETISLLAGVYTVTSPIVLQDVSLVGAGSVNGSVLRSSLTTTGDIIQISGGSQSSPVRLSGVSISATSGTIQPSDLVDVGVSRTSASHVEIEDVAGSGGTYAALHVSGDIDSLLVVDSEFTNSAKGIIFGRPAIVKNVTITDSVFNHNVHGLWAAFDKATDRGSLDQLLILDSVFNDNSDKGLYFEKGNNISLIRVTVERSGTRADYSFNNGIDINLKWRTYINFLLDGVIVRESGLVTLADDNQGNALRSSALAIKARDDAPSYSNPPASLTGLIVRNSIIEGATNAIVFGEPGKGSNMTTGASGVVVESNSITAASNGCTISNVAKAALSLGSNWWGSSVVPTNSTGLCSESGAGPVRFNIPLDGPNGSPVLTAGTITGQVLDSTGVGVSGVQVSARSTQVTTDGLGRYELTDLAANQAYTVTISATPKEGFIPAGPTSRVVFLATGQAATADFQITPTASITGRVTDLIGTGVSGVTVNVGAMSTTTNADGRYSFTGITTNQPYTVTISASGAGLPSGYVAAGPTSRQVFLAADGATGADFVVTRTLAVLARVVDTLGSPISGASVTIGNVLQTTGVSGTTTRTVTAGSVEVALQAPSGYVIVGPSSTQVNVSDGSSATVTFVLAATSSITGRVVDTVGVGVAGVTVTLGGAGTGSTTTRSDGTYQFIGLTSTGSHSITISVPGGFAASGATRRTVNLASGGSATAAFVLAEQGAITGRVVDDIGAGIAGVTVTLSANPQVTTTTGLDGRYRFGGLTVGQTFAVSVSRPGNFVEPANMNSRLAQTVPVGSSAVDVVLLPPGIVSGFAFLDFDGDGERSDGEPALGGIGVTLCNNQAGNQTTVTSATGYYRFEQAPQGSTVVLGTTGGFIDLSETSTCPVAAATIRSQAVDLTQFLQDFPLLPPGVIAGAVVLPDGSPVGGVTITGITGKSGISTGADGTFYVSGVGSGTFNVAATPPTGFVTTANSSLSITLSDSVTSATALLQLAEPNMDEERPNTVTPAPPVGEVLGPSVRIAVGSLRTPVVRAETANGLVELIFEGLELARGDASIVVTPISVSNTSDRGVISVGSRFRMTADGARFASVEVCLPVDTAAFRALGVDISRLRLVHRRTNGTEADITSGVDLNSSPPRVCGVTTSFSDFQVVALATERIAGSDRYATAAEVALDMYPTGATTVYVASGEQHPDALVAGLAAAENGAPLLLVRTSVIPDSTRRALASLDPSRVVVVGGESAVAANVITEMSSLTGARISRVAGTDRFDTSARLATTQYPDGVDTVYVASGLGFADALTAGVVAGLGNAALLLVSPTMVPTSVDTALRALSPRNIVIVGGSAAIDAAVAISLEAYGATVTRVGGIDRYDTAALLMSRIATRQGLVIATGRHFADALSATPLAVRNGSALLIVNGDVVPSLVRSQVTALESRSITVVGGVAAVGPTAELQLARLLPPLLPGRL